MRRTLTRLHNMNSLLISANDLNIRIKRTLSVSGIHGTNTIVRSRLWELTEL